MRNAEQWYYLAGAISFIGLLLFAGYKLKPESTRVFVESARVTVDLANGARDELAEKVDLLEERLEAMEARVAEADRRAVEAERRAAAADRLTASLRRELTAEQEKVHRLSAVVAALRTVLKERDIEIPPHLAGIDDI